VIELAEFGEVTRREMLSLRSDSHLSRRKAYSLFDALVSTKSLSSISRYLGKDGPRFLHADSILR
jgi:hypothetical protein